MTSEDLEAIEGNLGELLRRETKRWFAHLRRVRFTRRFPIYDLAAALYVLGEEGLAMEETVAEMRRSTFIEFGRGRRPVKVCVRLDRELLWRRFLRSTARAPRPR